MIEYKKGDIITTLTAEEYTLIRRDLGTHPTLQCFYGQEIEILEVGTSYVKIKCPNRKFVHLDAYNWNIDVIKSKVPTRDMRIYNKITKRRRDFKKRNLTW